VMLRRGGSVMRHRLIVSAAVLAMLVAGESAVRAADRPVAGDRLTLQDPAGNPDGRAVRFRAARDPAVDPASGTDPRTVGATLEVVGAGPGDGDTGPIPLPSALWTGLGNPAGSKGYRFKDPLRADGVKTILLKPGNAGGTLTVAGGGREWSYTIDQAQGTVRVRLTVGPDGYCARCASFDTDQTRK